LADQCPAVGQPERGVGVAALRDEVAVFGVRDETVRERVVANERLVTRSFVVEAERLASRPDLEEPARAAGEGERRGGCFRGLRQLRVDRPDRVREEYVLDVRQQQLLVLLLVMEAELDEERERGI